MSDDHKKEIDDVTGVETTGHVWDGIRELNNPLPRWWVWIFYATVVFAIGYMVYYPAVPLINSATQGVGGYSSRAELESAMEAAQAEKAGMLQQLAETDVSDIPANDELMRFATAGGESAYKVYCSQCHGSGAQGGYGYPNLNDDAWIWGGDLETIYTTIAHGIRYDGDPDSRFSMMPSFGVDQILDRDQIQELAHYVRSLSGLEHDAQMAAAAAENFDVNCSSCHGVEGEGMTALGAPNLSDAIWLYGSETDQIASQVHNPKHGVMPAWVDRLGETTVKQLTVYVHSLGGGE